MPLSQYLPERLEKLNSNDHEAIDKAVESMKLEEMTMVPDDSFNIEAYKLLLKCALKKDMNDWNNFASEQTCQIMLGSAVLAFKNIRLYLLKANLKGAYLPEAILRGAILRGANLQGANLQGANLHFTNFFEVNLKFANLRGVSLDSIQREYVNKLQGTIVDNIESYNRGRWAIIIRVASTIAATSALLMAISMVISLIIPDKNDVIKPKLPVKVQNIDFQKQFGKIKVLEQELIWIKKDFDSRKNLGWKIEAGKMQIKINNLEDKLNAFQRALTTVDPVKALAVPMLRKDLDNAERELGLKVDHNKRIIEHAETQITWLIGIVVTISLSALGIFLPILLNKKNA